MEVSVSIVTYNHEKYIEQALTSVLSQKVNFDYEILVGEDGSDDATAKIVRDFEIRFPDKIRAFYHDRTNVLYVKGRPTARNNYLNNLKQARGKYIAVLDGDDFWTRDYKLQKQRDFLNQHKDCSTCFHAVDYVSAENEYLRTVRPPRRKAFYTLHDLIPDNFVHSGSVMFRHNQQFEFPSWFYQIGFGDWAQHLMRATDGCFGYIDEPMSAYRIHGGGRWSTHAAVRRIVESMEVLDYFDQHTSHKFEKEIQTAIQRMDHNLVLKFLDSGDLSAAREHMKKLSERPSSDRLVTALDYSYVALCAKFPFINALMSESLRKVRLLLD